MMKGEIVNSLDSVDAAAWDALVGVDNPFVEHAFLAGLERSGSVGAPQTGWVPRHVLVRTQDRLVGAMPLYEKSDSYGEFIFDWAWARGAMQAGLPYYPKVVSAVPFTPATGPRLLLAPNAPPQTAAALLAGAQQVARACQASSLHVLFCQEAELPALQAAGLAARRSYQFHWQRQPNWHTFEDYLAALRAPARKQVRRERAQAASHGLRIVMQRGDSVGDAEWDAMYTFYRCTVAEKGAAAYLTRGFFTHLQHYLGTRVYMALAYQGTVPVAGSLYLTKGSHLYGRYWGTTVPQFDALHFELCYYLPIEWGLAHGIQRFEAGAQGEHKIKRGLLPNLCHSAHWIAHPGLAEAVAGYIRAEANAVQVDMNQLTAHTPYKRGNVS